MSVVIYGDDCIFFASFMTDAVGCLRTSANLLMEICFSCFSLFSHASCGLVGSAVSAMLWFSLRLKGKWSTLINLQYLIAQID